MEKVIQIISQVSGVASVEPDRGIHETGLSSIHRLSLLLALEEEFGINIPDDAFITANTPRAIAQLIEQLRTHV